MNDNKVFFYFLWKIDMEKFSFFKIWTPSFQDSDGDGQGDLQGISDRLEDLRRLGIEAIWPEPFLLSDQFDDAIRDFKAVDSKIGLNDDGIDLIEKTHSKGR